MRTLVTLFIVFINLFIWANTPELDKKLNTAKNAAYLSPIEKEIIYEINLFRSNPVKYANEYIRPLAKYYQGNILHYPNDISIKTREGVKALYECVKVLNQAGTLPLMQPDKALSNAANDHQRDQAESGKTGHIGTDRSDVKGRIERYGKWKVRIAENIAYGNTSARQIVIFLLIDDGVKSRGHRLNLLHPDLNTVGVSFGKHPVYRTICVMDFAGGMFKN
ncbi:MAG: CAP domain-containing protein [Bacteroidota bacterium]